MISLLPFLTLFMWMSGDLQLIRQVFQRVKQKPAFFILLLCTSILAAVQLWLFLWAPMHGRGMQVSLGYFLLPLVLVLVGSVFYKEKLSNFQKIAVGCAAAGVLHELWRMGTIPWETLLVALGYSAYFFLRKVIKTDHLGGFWWDNILMLPVAIYFVQTWTLPLHTFIEQPHLIAAVTGLGILSAIGLGSYILASRHLPMVLFGLLSYLEPVLLAIAAMILGEKIHAEEWLTYLPIWCAVAILVLEGMWHIYLQQRKRQALLINIEKFSERSKVDRE